MLELLSVLQQRGKLLHVIGGIQSSAPASLIDVLLETLSAALMPSASGLKWQNIDANKPSQGRELEHYELQRGLCDKTDMKEAEWKEFGIGDLCMDHFVKSGGFFKPAESAEPEQLRQLRGFAVEMVAGCSLGGLLAATKSPSAAVDTLLKMAKQ